MAYTSPASYPSAATAERTHAGAYQAYGILHFAFAAIPMIAGVDKFFYYLADWSKYLAPIVPETTGIDARTIMMIVGAVEIIAGLVVAFAPRIGGYLVAAWLAGIIVNLAIHPTKYWDIAARDFGLMLGAISLSSLARWVDEHKRASVPPVEPIVP
jgi:hypothetical protein